MKHPSMGADTLDHCQYGAIDPDTQLPVQKATTIYHGGITFAVPSFQPNGLCAHLWRGSGALLCRGTWHL